MKVPKGTPISWSWEDYLVSGLIVMWHGSIASIPSGWVICDGNNSTPNLLARFVQGIATAATDPGATGGEATHALTEAELAAHKHRAGYSEPAFMSDTAGKKPSGYPGDGSYSTSTKGSGNAHQNEPPFYDVAFIMKT